MTESLRNVAVPQAFLFVYGLHHCRTVFLRRTSTCSVGIHDERTWGNAISGASRGVLLRPATLKPAGTRRMAVVPRRRCWPRSISSRPAPFGAHGAQPRAVGRQVGGRRLLLTGRGTSTTSTGSVIPRRARRPCISGTLTAHPGSAARCRQSPWSPSSTALQSYARRRGATWIW